MSNRLSFAHLAPRGDLPEWLSGHGAFAASAVTWLRGVGGTDELPRTMQRDLGLPEVGPDETAFECEIVRSRVRV